MNKVILILSTSGTSNEAIEFAVKEAKERNSSLLALYIIETGLTNELFDRFTDIGFIGDKPSSDLVEAVQKEYRQRGYEEIGKAQVRAMEESVNFDAVTLQGEFLKEAEKAIDEHDASLVVAVRKKKHSFLKYFSRSLADELKKRSKVEVIIFNEEG
ncbi:MAG: universal stress protein [Deltaproteobacteria bacterium]|nr:universal stress protein [Deltaproteobacteria bacterium]